MTMMDDEMPDSKGDEILDPAERAELLETARLLERSRPLPRPAFMGGLARSLRARPAPPARLRLLIGAYAASGLALLAMVAVGLAGVGPLSP